MNFFNHFFKFGKKAILLAGIPLLLSLLPAIVQGQNIVEQKINLNVNNAALKTAFAEIEKQTNVRFIYGEDINKYASNKVTIAANNISVGDAISHTLNNTNLRYTQRGYHVVIDEKPASTPQQQTPRRDKGSLQGTVRDETGEPVAGATVVVQGTTTGTITDIDGKYTLSGITEGTVEIQVSFIGYEMQRVNGVKITADHSTPLNIVLKETSQQLSEVVVIGYGTQKRTDLTGSLSSVSNDKLVNTHLSTATQALYGQLPGVDIVTSGTKPGGGADIMIRGQNTIKSGTDLNGINPPLYVVDGIFVSSINDISPNDIERIDVLKDASSTAIYGSRGANGVIIVTTRKGTQDRSRIEYNGSVTMNAAMNLPDFTTAEEWVQYRIDRRKGQNYTNPAFEPDLLELLGESAYNNYQAGKFVDWPGEILKTSYSQQHAVSVDGSAEKLTYSLGLGINSDNGVIDGDSYTRYNASAALNKQINNIFKIGTSMYAAYEITKSASPETFRTIYRLNSLADKYDTDGSLLFYPDRITTITNPFLEMKNRHMQNNSFHAFGNMYLEVKPLSWLKFTTTFAPDISHAEYGVYIGSMTKTGAGALANNSGRYEPARTVKYTWDNILFAENTWGDHSANLTLGTSWYQSGRMASMLSARAFPTDAYDWYNLGSGTMAGMSTAWTQEQLNSYFGRINYDYKDRYLVTVTGRADGSSKLAEGHKWAFFPSAAVAWRISEESFLKDKTALSNLKLRFSYGVSGNNGVSPYSTYPTVNNTGRYLFGDDIATTTTISRFENKTLSWELTEEFNLGVDFGFYHGRISGSIDLYNRRTDDIIMNRVMSQLNGFGSLTDNVGSVNNKGVEISLNTVNVQTKDFSWSTSLNIASNQNEIVSLSDGSERDEANRWFVGQPVGVVWTYDHIGFWGEDEVAEAARYGLAPGSIKVRDIDGSGTMNNADKVFKGSLFPKWTGGITNTITYKNADLAFTVTTRQGQYADSQFHRSYSMTDNENFNVLDLNYWTLQNTHATWMRPGVPSGPMEVLYYQKASYVKIGYINLGYNLPGRVIDKLNLSKLRIYASCQNPFVFTDYGGWDPEMASRDTQGPAYPMTRKFMLGLNVAF